MTHRRPELQELKDKISGQDVFIIGGGPSLLNFDFKRLDGQICIALNNAYKFRENWTAIFWADPDWVSPHTEKLIAYDCLKFTAKTFADEYVRKNIKTLGDGTVLKKGPDFGFSLDEDTVAGNNSGAMALNLTVNMKAHRIFLLGYDMGFKDGRSHFHEGYEISDPTVYGNLFVPSIMTMAKLIKNMPVEIINLNPNDSLPCFKRDDIDKYL